MNQTYSQPSTTNGHITDCKLDSGGVCRCMRGDLMWTCLVWAERSTPDNFRVPSHRFNSATGEQKGITQTIYTDSEPPSRMPNSLAASLAVCCIEQRMAAPIVLIVTQMYPISLVACAIRESMKNIADTARQPFATETKRLLV